MKKSLLLITCGLTAGLGLKAAAQPTSPVEAAAVEWSRAHATHMAEADVTPFKQLTANVRMLGLGEGTHNAHEFYAYRNRLFFYLVENAGFTVFAAESSFLDSVAVDDYVQGKGELTPELVHSAFSWTEVGFEENRDLLQWIRSYNARPQTKKPIHFYGLEMCAHLTPRSSGKVEYHIDGKPATQAALLYVKNVDPAAAKVLTAILDPLLPKFEQKTFGQLSAVEQDRLTAGLEDLLALFARREVAWEKQTGNLAFQRANRCAVVARQIIAQFRARVSDRDVDDSENLRWILEQAGSDGKVFLYAHNSHVSKHRADPHNSIGEFMVDLLGQRYVSVAMLYDQGVTQDWFGLFNLPEGPQRVKPSQPGSLNYAMAQVPLDRFYLNLHELPTAGPVAEWFCAVRPVRNINVPEGYTEMSASRSFDAVIFIRNISALHPLQ